MDRKSFEWVKVQANGTCLTSCAKGPFSVLDERKAILLPTGAVGSQQSNPIISLSPCESATFNFPHVDQLPPIPPSLLTLTQERQITLIA